MKDSALKKALARQRTATIAANDLLKAGSISDQGDAWFRFLTAHSAIFEALKAGALDAGGSWSSWFGQIRGVRRRDPLLSYLHHARDCDYHGVAESSARTSARATAFIGDIPIMTISGATFDDDSTIEDLKAANPFANAKALVNGKDVPLRYVLQHQTLALIPVVDERFGDEFPPPRSHLGRDIDGTNPAEVSKLATNYTKRIISDAQGRMTNPRLKK